MQGSDNQERMFEMHIFAWFALNEMVMFHAITRSMKMRIALTVHYLNQSFW